MRNITEIQVHCSATRPSWMAADSLADKVAEIRKWHVRDNGWRDIGYHFLIDRDGEVATGRPLEMVGAFDPAVNARAVGICLIGGHGSQQNDAFEQHFTEAQDDALRTLIEQLRSQFQGVRKVTGHNDYSGKACPGFRVGSWLNRSRPRAFIASHTAVSSGTAALGGGGLVALDMLGEIQGQVQQVQQASADTAMAAHDPLKWVLLALVVCGAGYALWRRWVDWQRGRQ